MGILLEGGKVTIAISVILMVAVCCGYFGPAWDGAGTRTFRLKGQEDTPVGEQPARAVLRSEL
jgi:hypothetical protein